MATTAYDKVLVTNEAALIAKYGASYKASVQPAIAALIAADRARGLSAQIVRVDNKLDMAACGKKVVTTAKDEKQNKAAIDAIFRTYTPPYLVLLGSIDVIPHQQLINPAADDGDAHVPSDLPYACDAAYSKDVHDFLSPTRVVGRLPDLTGTGDPDYFARVLQSAAKLEAQALTQYAPYLGLTAQVWEASTSQSLKAVFGDNGDLQTIPEGAPPWTTRIARLAHFINCHGADVDTKFYGQEGKNYPVAHDAAQMTGVRPATVVSAECCYGAQLFDPKKTKGQSGICHTYLGMGAAAFFGSTTIAYGPSSGNAQADLVCQYFMKHVFAGASTGEAVLQARLDFIRSLSPSADPTDLKTIAQFNLIGDPSIHPVASASSPDETVVPAAISAKKGAKGAVARAIPDVRAATRRERREHLAALGEAIGAAVPYADVKSRRAASPRVKKILATEMRSIGARVVSSASFAVHRPPASRTVKALSGAARRGARGAALAPASKLHLAIGKLPADNAPFKRLVVIVALEQDGQTLLRRTYSK
jgi:hypothetical protein